MLSIGSTEVELEGLGIWALGRDLLTCTVTLAQGENGSTVQADIADPTGYWAQALIQHSLTSGGIAPLPRKDPPVSPAAPGAQGATNSEIASKGMTPARKATLDLIAWCEGADYQTIFTGAKFSSYADHPRQVKCSGGLCSDAAGRYQFLSTTWDPLGLPDFSPANQDLGALRLMSKTSLARIDSADPRQVEQAIADDFSYIWASMPPYRYPGQGVKTMPQTVAKWVELYNYHRGQPSSAIPANPAPANSNTPANPVEYKGRKLIVRHGEAEWSFLHQGTEARNTGALTLSGVGPSWHLSRRIRTEAHGETSLKKLAAKICTSRGVSLDWLPAWDPEYSYVAQAGLSDYALLRRECDRVGFSVSDAKGKITIADTRTIEDTAFVAAVGSNLLEWSFADRAVDSYQDEGSSVAISDNKATVDPASGDTVATPDIERAPGGPTGKTSPAPTGNLNPGHDAIAQVSRGRLKRVKGLPGTLSLISSAAAYTLAPFQALRTQGLPAEVLNRVWVIDSVSHDLREGQTTVNVYSPVEVPDNAPTSTPVTAPGPVGPPGQWQVPCHGPITSPRGMRVHPVTGEQRFHHGTDIGVGEGTPLVAPFDGVVVAAEWVSGYGNLLDIAHTDGRLSRMAHLSSWVVKSGPVRKGQLVAYSGQTGLGTGAHLHFEVRTGGPYGPSQEASTVGFPTAVGQSW